MTNKTKTNKWVERARNMLDQIIEPGFTIMNDLGFVTFDIKKLDKVLQDIITQTQQDTLGEVTKILKGYMPSEEKIWQELDKLNLKYK